MARHVLVDCPALLCLSRSRTIEAGAEEVRRHDEIVRRTLEFCKGLGLDGM